MAEEGSMDRINLLLEIIATELYVARADRERLEDLDVSWHELDRELAIDNLRKMRGKLSLLAVSGDEDRNAEPQDSEKPIPVLEGAPEEIALEKAH